MWLKAIMTNASVDKDVEQWNYLVHSGGNKKTDRHHGREFPPEQKVSSPQ